MSIIIQNIKLNPDDSDDKALEIAAKKIKGAKAESLFIRRKSIDSRDSDNLKIVYSVQAHLYDVKTEQRLAQKDKNIIYKENIMAQKKQRNLPSVPSPVIVGFGPAGMFAGLTLARAGLKPIILERGSSIEKRSAAVNRFWREGVLSSTNVQFGEGGAGTFSDGKLTTGINDPLCSYILDTLVEMGADENILTMAKPHIGTDILRKIVINIRKEIIKLGGNIYLDSPMTDIVFSGNKLVAVKTAEEVYETDSLILAIGHSARDTQKLLLQKGLKIIQKPFSVGVRLEQLQSDVDRAMYGKFAGHPNLPPSEYKLSYREGERGVYSFCMCPGGYVVASASDEGQVVTNGMSFHDRAGENANSAIVVSVLPQDFCSSSPLAGAEFQQQLEHSAFLAGGGNYFAPVQNTMDFINGAVSSKLSLAPTYKPGTTPYDINKILPSFVTDMLKKSFYRFDKQRAGFNSINGVLTGVETRTSSPICICRDENYMAINKKGIFPTGEGAGYAGGIMSAACDGIRVANKILDMAEEH